MQKDLMLKNKRIAEHLGYSYVPWNNPNKIEQGWQRLDVSPSLRPYTRICKFHNQLNFHCDIQRSEILLKYLIDCRYTYSIEHSGEGVSLLITKPHKEDISEFGNNIPEIVFKAFLKIIANHYK